MEYTLIIDKRRKKLLLRVEPTGEVIVKAGLYTSEDIINSFVNKNVEWIKDKQEYFKSKYHFVKMLDKNLLDEAKSQTKKEMLEIVEKYASIMEVEPSGVKVTKAEKRWGSCSGKKSICFSYKCMFLSQFCKEYLVVHELSHIKHMDHSKQFYKTVEKYFPQYKEAEKELNGYYIRLK